VIAVADVPFERFTGGGQAVVKAVQQLSGQVGVPQAALDKRRQIKGLGKIG
jgi:hypothetical protein